MASSLDYDSLVESFLHKRRIALVRSFGDLGLRNILRLHAELHVAEERYKQALSAYAAIATSTNASQTSQPGTPSETTPDLQQLADEADRKLREFYTFVLKYAQINNLPEPDEVDLDTLEEVLKHSARIGILDDTPWKRCLQEDLVALFSRSYRKRDRVTTWVTKRLSRWKDSRCFRRFAKFLPGVTVDETLPNGQEFLRLHSQKLSSWVTVALVVLATALNNVSMFALYTVDSITVRFVIIWLFTLVFAAAMVLTASDSISMFTATAAYSAVLVVFVGGAT